MSHRPSILAPTPRYTGSMFTSWSESEGAAGRAVSGPADHLASWLASLEPQSAYTRHLPRTDVLPADLRRYALDAAAGVALEVSRLQDSCLADSSWTRRVEEWEAMVRAIRLPIRPPAGVGPGEWAALSAVLDAPVSSWDQAEEQLPTEVGRLRRAADESRALYEHTVRSALKAGAAVDSTHRRAAVMCTYELTTHSVFRTGWARLYGGLRSRPKAGMHVAVQMLDQANLLTREIGLFLEHIGVTVTPRVPNSGRTPLQRLQELDNEVHNARRAWKRIGRSPEELVGLVEWVAHEEREGVPEAFLRLEAELASVPVEHQGPGLAEQIESVSLLPLGASGSVTIVLRRGHS